MKQIESRKIEFNKYDSIKEFIVENGWYIPSLHEKYLVENEVKNEDMNISSKEIQRDCKLWKQKREDLERNMTILES